MDQLTRLIVVILMLTGCSQYDPARAVYEGIKTRQETLKTPNERAMSTPLPDYDSYRKAREQAKTSDNSPN
jgi:hypothetical protein